MTNLYRDEVSDPKRNAQRNLCGRTHYVDDDTLRWHKSRIVSTHVPDEGLLFAIVSSDALDMNNTRRGFRYVIFDVFGTVLGRTKIDEAFSTSKQAKKAMWSALNEIDAKSITKEAISRSRNQHIAEMDQLWDKVETIGASKVA